MFRDIDFYAGTRTYWIEFGRVLFSNGRVDDTPTPISYATFDVRRVTYEIIVVAVDV